MIEAPFTAMARPVGSLPSAPLPVLVPVTANVNAGEIEPGLVAHRLSRISVISIE